MNRKQAPDFKAIDRINLIKPEHIRLKNGCNIFCFNSGDQELVQIEWIFNNLHFNTEKPLLNMAVNTMLTDGTSQLSASQIADKIDYYGAFLSTEYSFDHSQITLHSLTKHLKDVLPVIKDVITGSVFPEKELKTYIRNQQQKLQVRLQKNDIVARRTFNKAICGNTIYGLTPVADDYKQLQQADMLAHFKQMYQPSNCTLIIAGKVERHIIELLSTIFDNGWTNLDNPPDTTQPAIEPSSEHFYFIEKPDVLQSAIRMGLPFINRTHPDFPAAQVLNTVLGGYFGSRLMTNIREDKGYTYGIGSGIRSFKHEASWYITTEVGADVCKAATIEIEKEIALLKTEAVPDEELSLVRNYMLGSLLGSLENVFSHADKFKNLYFSGLDYEYYDRYTETVKNVTAAELLMLANKYLNFDKFYKVIVGKY